MGNNNQMKTETHDDCNAKFVGVDEKFSAIDARFAKLNTQLSTRFNRLADALKDLGKGVEEETILTLSTPLLD
ncbi:MAG: hypothetical protein V4471_05375 [Pseudomonadota bacterium]